MIHVRGPFRCFPDGISSAASSVLAGIAGRCSLLPGILYCLSGTQVSVPTEGSHGTCCCGISMESSSDGPFGHVCDHSEGPSVRSGDVGLFFQMDGSVPVARQELCILCGAHKTKTTPYHPESDGLVERFNRTLLLAMFAGRTWDDFLLAVMMAYRSSVHESMGFSPYRLMFGEECTLPMDVGLPRRESDLPDLITSPHAVWVRDALEVAYDQVRRHSGQAVQRQKRLYDRRAVRRLFAVGDWILRHYFPAKKCKLCVGWSVYDCVPGRMGSWYSATSGFTHCPCTLRGSEENGGSSTEGLSHGSSVRRQYNGPHFTGFPLGSCCTSGGGGRSSRRCLGGIRMILIGISGGLSERLGNECFVDSSGFSSGAFIAIHSWSYHPSTT